jgi:hypothetical protein
MRQALLEAGFAGALPAYGAPHASLNINPPHCQDENELARTACWLRSLASHSSTSTASRFTMFPGVDPAQLQQMMSSPQFAGVRQMMQTPEMQRLVQQLTSEPSISDSLKQMQEAAMSGNLQNVMQSIQGNPKVMQFVQQMGTQMFAQNPMLQALQNPGSREQVEKQMSELQKDPEMADLMKEMQSQGPNALQKYWNDPEILKKLSKYGERLAAAGMFPGMADGDGAKGAKEGADATEQATRELQAVSLKDDKAEQPAEEEEEEFVCLQDAVLEGDLGAPCPHPQPPVLAPTQP